MAPPPLDETGRGFGILEGGNNMEQATIGTNTFRSWFINVSTERGRAIGEEQETERDDVKE